jgi:hypothetical protein
MSNESENGLFDGDLYFNGINGVTVDYGLQPMSSKRLAQLIQGKGDSDVRDEALLSHGVQALTDQELRHQTQANTATLNELKDKRARHRQLGEFPVKEGVDATSLAQSGWAIVFPEEMESRQREAIKEALAPLLEHRRNEAGDLYRVFEGGNGYRSNERKDQFCQRQTPEIRRGPADPAQMPYYVLLVGSPAQIPYNFQFQLDVMRAVGRIDFGEDMASYSRYAQAVVMTETGQVKLPRKAAFFGVANPGDKATQLSAEWLVKPLYENLQVQTPKREVALTQNWQLNKYIGQDSATKSQLQQLLGGDQEQTPAFLFTASHGVEFPISHAKEQLNYQGALLCQDWNGPGSGLKRDHYFAGEDLTCDSCVLGTMAMFFACYGAGTPHYNDFAMQAFKARAPIAPAGFVGALPNRLLSQGMLAVVGHVERAWGYSFVSPTGKLENQAFVTAIRKLMNGEPVGLATDPSFNLRYADMASNLSQVLADLHYEPDTISDYELAHLWAANNDARNYVVVGDPAARLVTESPPNEAAVRPKISVASSPQESTGAAVDIGSGPARPMSDNADRGQKEQHDRYI